MTLKVTMANGSSDSVDFVNVAGTTLAQVKGYDDGSSNGHVEIYTTSAGTSSEKVRIDKDGNVGIGTSSPTQKITIGGASTSDQQINMSFDNGSLGIKGGSGSNAALIALRGGTSSFNGAGMEFYTNNAERARIDSSGNLLVGTTSTTGNQYGGAPGITLGGGNALNIKSTGYATYGLLNYLGNLVWNNGSDRMAMDPSGNLRVPAVYALTTGAAANMHCAADGTFYRSTSSLKYKTDVQDATHGLNEVMALRPVIYKGKTDGDLIFGGLIAEEVHEAGLTEFVQYAEDGTPDALAYSNMVSLCIKAIQELKAELDAVKAQLENK